jgi:hypothetical protein
MPPHEPVGSQLRTAAAKLNDALAVAATPADVEGAFAAFLGSAVCAELRRVPRGTVADQWKAQLRAALPAFYRYAGGWCLSKPYGYPGDFRILEAVYNGQFHVEPDAVNVAIDRWGLSLHLPLAVRARKNALRWWLSRTLNGGEGRLLSIACGSARELRELDSPLLASWEVVLLDFDPRALHAAMGDFGARPEVPSVSPVCLDVLRAGPEDLTVLGAPYDIIYSFGLFDYLKDDLLLACASRFTPLLADGGRFVFALKDHRYYDAWFYDWFFDWRFVPRTLDDGPRIAEALGLRVTETLVLESRTIGIFVCER